MSVTRFDFSWVDSGGYSRSLYAFDECFFMPETIVLSSLELFWGIFRENEMCHGMSISIGITISGRSLQWYFHCTKSLLFTGEVFDVVLVTCHMTEKTLKFEFRYSNSTLTRVLNVRELKTSISFSVRWKNRHFVEKIGLFFFIVKYPKTAL